MLKYVYGFPSQYVLDNILHMSGEEVKYWQKEYDDYKGNNNMKARTWKPEELVDDNGNDIIPDQDHNLIDNNKYDCYEDEDEILFVEDKVKPLTSYFKGE